MKAWLRDPLVHFVILGGLVFAAHRMLAPESIATDDAEVIVIDSAFVDALARERAGRLGVPEGTLSRAQIQEDFVREEALVREARSLGLDVGDGIIRRRLVQKLELFMRAGVEVPEPTDDALEAYLVAHAEEHREPPRVSFEHRYFSNESRPGRAMEDARAALVDEGQGGDAFPLGARLERREVSEIAASFGAGLAALSIEAPLGTWAGPVESRYGAHLIRVSERSEGRALGIDEVRGVLRARVIEQEERVALEAALGEIVDRYRVDEGP